MRMSLCSQGDSLCKPYPVSVYLNRTNDLCFPLDKHGFFLHVFWWLVYSKDIRPYFSPKNFRFYFPRVCLIFANYPSFICWPSPIPWICNNTTAIYQVFICVKIYFWPLYFMPLLLFPTFTTIFCFNDYCHVINPETNMVCNIILFFCKKTSLIFLGL